ncbi:MAG: hypothetical protein JNM89_16020 [Hyphomicrobiaceae bacterium]|nr:hypothetical protein [Hyphomicrobiaceae bacterium]
MIRTLLLAFGLIGGAVVVALVARHGFLTADTPLDGYALAALLSLIAIGGLVGHAVAAHLWPVSRGAAAGVFLLATAALLLNLSTSFEAIIGRAATGEAERSQRIKDRAAAERELATLSAELSGLRDHVPVSADAAKAARDRATAAAEQREAECAKRGNRCRDREADERAALETLATIERDRAFSIRRADLESRTAKLRTSLAEIPATGHPNVMAAGIARLFRLPEADALSAATWHKLAIAGLVELLIAAAFFAAEVSRNGSATNRPEQTLDRPEFTQNHSPALTPAPIVEPAPVKEIDPKPVIAFLADRVEARRGSRVSLADLYRAYVASEADRALGAAEFAAALRTICDHANWDFEAGDGDMIFLAGRRLRPTRPALEHVRRAS